MQQMKKGTSAVAAAVRAVQPDVVSAYPITPQTGIVETLAQFAADGRLEGEYLQVDSEFNAASSCIGASAAGARTFSATSSQGLKLMSEPLFTASGMRLPLVLAVANRSLSAPISIWNDHTDAFAERDGGMIQFFAEDVQEAVDNILMSYRVAERPDISLPVLANMDGYILTHVKEPVDIPDEDAAAAYLPRRTPNYTLDPSDPVTMGTLADPDHWTEARYVVHDALARSKDAIREATEEFADMFGREYGLEYGGMLETYGPADAPVTLVALGSLAGTIKAVLDETDAPVKLVRPRVLRPFPTEALRDALADSEAIGVLTKEVSPGFGSGLAGELKSVLYATDIRAPIRTFVVGLAGRDITRGDIRNAINDLQSVAGDSPVAEPAEEESWPQLRPELLSQEVDLP